MYFWGFVIKRAGTDVQGVAVVAIVIEPRKQVAQQFADKPEGRVLKIWHRRGLIPTMYRTS
jgi:hypothetical protein